MPPPWHPQHLSDGLLAMRASRAATAASFGAALLLLAASLTLLPGRPAPPPPLRAVVLDTSASATRRATAAESALRAVLAREAEAAAREGEELLVVAFDRDARRVFGPGDPRDLRRRLEARDGPPLALAGPAGAPGADGGSELARALRAVASAAAGRAGSLLLVGDGSATGEDPRPALERLLAQGLDWRAPEPLAADLPDGALLALEAPRRVEPGAPAAVRALVRVRPGALAAAGAMLEVSASGPGGAWRREVPLDVAPGVPTPVEVDLGGLPFGTTRVRAAVRLADGLRDPIPENDGAERAIAAGDPRALAVAAPRELLPLAARLAGSSPPGIEGRALACEELAAALPELDAVVLVDAPLDALPGPLLASFVRSGGGLLLAGGLRSLAGWDPDAAPDTLAGLLPLAPARGGARRDVVLLVDGSGSMEGAPFDALRAAAVELVRAAPAADEIALRFFTAVLKPEEVLRAAGASDDRAELLRRLLAARVPGGPTRIVESLEQLARERARAGAPGLVLLLSDGREEADVLRPDERIAALARDLAASDTRLVAIAVGAAADRAFLERLAGPDGVRDGSDPARLADVFRREVNGERLREGAAELVPGAGPLARSILPADFAPPPVDARLACTARADAEVLASAGGEPAVAAARVGRGRAVALAFAPGGPWAPAWSAADLGPLLAWLARRSEPRPRARLAGGQVLVDDLPGAPPWLEGTLEAAGGAGAHPVGLGLDPLRAGRLAGPAPAGLPAVGELVLRVQDPPLALLVEREPDPEHAAPEHLPPGPLPATGRPGAIPPRGPSPAAPWLLGAGIAAALLAGLARSAAGLAPSRPQGAAGRQGMPTSDR